MDDASTNTSGLGRGGIPIRRGSGSMNDEYSDASIGQ